MSNIARLTNNNSPDQEKTTLDHNPLQTQALDIVLYIIIFGLFPINRQLHLLFILLAIIILIIKNNQKLSVPYSTALLGGIFITFLVPSTLKALIPTFSIYVSTCWFVGFLFFLHLFKANKATTKHNLLISLKISFILSVFLLFISTCYLSIKSGGLPVINKSEIVHIFYRTENYVASYITLLLPFSLTRTNNKLLRTFSIVALAIGLYLILTGVSQSNIVLSILMLIAWLFIYAKSIFSNRKILYSAITGIVGIIASVALTQIGKSGNLKIVSEFKGMAERYDLWEATIKLIGENPIIGVGLGNWMIRVEKFTNIRSAIVHPHNLYLEIGSEIGMVAFLSFLGLFFLVIIKKILGINRKNYFDIACILSLFTYLINSFVYGTINHQYMAFSSITSIAFTILFILQSDIQYKNQITTKVPTAISLLFYISIFVYHAFIYQSSAALTKKMNQKERKTALLNQYNKTFYSHLSKNYSIADQLVEHFDLSAEEKRFFIQELAFQYPYDFEYVTNFVGYLIADKKYNQAIFHYKNLGFESNENYTFKLKLAELYYLNMDIDNGDKLINEIREIPSKSIQSDGIEKVREIANIKSKAYGLQQKYSK